MLLRRDAHQIEPRRGVILMVVLAMLTLFAIVGITFVLFSDATAMSARINRESETQVKPEMDAELAMSLFLGQMIYDAHDDTTGTQSAMRGHSFARTMYGASFTTGANDANGRPTYQGDNFLPYCGVGRYHYNNPLLANTDEYNMPSYQYFATDPSGLKGAVRDPERFGTRANPTAAFAANTYVAGNASYTYCDGNSMFLAYMDTATGEIKVPSFHRPSIFGALDKGTNLHWTSAAGKYMSLRPRPLEHPNFPYPQDLGGDVKNLDQAPGGCDSIWIDIGAPVMKMADGRKYKMLVAPLILDLDGRLNLNTAGNILGANKAHASNQGWGAWEVNPSKVLNAAAPLNVNEWQNLFAGSAYTTTTNNYGRYGVGGLPIGGAPATGTYLHNYAQIDWDGVNATPMSATATATGKYTLGTAPTWRSYPTFPAGYGNAVPTETTNAGGAQVHPMMYNPLLPSSGNRALSVQSMHALLRAGGSGSEFITSDLRILADNLARDPNAQKRRNQITTLSMDLERPGVIPFIVNPNDSTAQINTRFTLPSVVSATNIQPYQPTGQPIPFPALTPRPAIATVLPGDLFNPNKTAGSEIDPATLRSIYAALGRVNLNRKLCDYPLLKGDALGAVSPTGYIDTTNAATMAQYNQAVSDRQQLAQDIFNVLIKVTGALDPATARTTPYGATSPEYQAVRWLAQLAVNIVDYIDEDDYMTPFHWDTGNQGPSAGGSADLGWVFGVELPRLTLNEAYAQVDNDNSDPKINTPPVAANAKTPGRYASLPYRMNVWVELHNPLPAETNPGYHTHANPNAQLQMPMGASGAVVPIYELVLTQTSLYAASGVAPTTANPLSDPANVTGDPDFNFKQGKVATSPINSTVNSWGTTFVAPYTKQTVTPANGAYSDPSKTNAGFYVIGALPPNGPAAMGAAAGSAYANPADNPNIPVTLASTQMSYPIAGSLTSLSTQAAAMPGVDVVLRRLACPHLPPQNSPSLPFYNPYITTDVLELTGDGAVRQVWDSRRYLPTQVTAKDDTATPPVPTAANRHSFGRLQPFAAAVSPALALVASLSANPATSATSTTPAQPAQPYHTFFRHNAVSATAPASIAASSFAISATGATETTNTVTITTTSPHGFVMGQLVAITGVGVGGYNGVFPIVSVVNPTTFTYTNPIAGLAASGNGFALGETLKTTFDWLTHLDRKLISPMELLNVSGVKPHELTHWFQSGSTQSASANASLHLARWTNGSGRLYRFFEFATTGSLQAGYSLGGRVPGKININTMGPSDWEIFFAICDAQQGNSFYNGATTDTAVIRPIFNQIIAERSPGAGNVPAAGDRPYLSLATGPIGANASGDAISSAGITRNLDSTLLRQWTVGAGGSGTGATSPRMLEPSFQSPAQYPVAATQTTTVHPYQRDELLNKIYNNLTVRSNVFAVWATVGFFAVEDDTKTPVTLGAEIGRSENRHVRHRMFAIVDRTNLQLQGATAATTTLSGAIPAPPVISPAATPPANKTYVEVAASTFLPAAQTDSRTNLQWTPQKAGTIIVVEPNTTNEETVTLYTSFVPFLPDGVTPNPNLGQVVGRFYSTLGHAKGVAFTVRGNPGPWFRYNPRSDTAVVPYFAVID